MSKGTHVLASDLVAEVGSESSLPNLPRGATSGRALDLDGDLRNYSGGVTAGAKPSTGSRGPVKYGERDDGWSGR